MQGLQSEPNLSVQGHQLDEKTPLYTQKSKPGTWTLRTYWRHLTAICNTEDIKQLHSGHIHEGPLRFSHPAVNLQPLPFNQSHVHQTKTGPQHSRISQSLLRKTQINCLLWNSLPHLANNPIPSGLNNPTKTFPQQTQACLQGGKNQATKQPEALIKGTAILSVFHFDASPTIIKKRLKIQIQSMFEIRDHRYTFPQSRNKSWTKSSNHIHERHINPA